MSLQLLDISQSVWVIGLETDLREHETVVLGCNIYLTRTPLRSGTDYTTWGMKKLGSAEFAERLSSSSSS